MKGLSVQRKHMRVRMSMCGKSIDTGLQWINKHISAKLGKDFVWTTLHINHNSVAKEHRDIDNEGTSAILLLGDFTGGAFVAEDCSMRTNVVNALHVFDGCQLHSSLAFQGERYSIKAYCHKGAERNFAQPAGTFEVLGLQLACWDSRHFSPRS